MQRSTDLNRCSFFSSSAEALAIADLSEILLSEGRIVYRLFVQSFSDGASFTRSQIYLSEAFLNT
jgi:hypothetical protein